MRNIIAASLLIATASVAHSEARIVVRDDMGGRISDYHERAQVYSAFNKKLKLVGQCASACNIYLMKRYHLDVCATEGSSLRFHMPYRKQAYTDGSLEMIVSPAHGKKAIAAWKRDWLGKFGPKLNDVLLRATSRGLIPNPNMSGDTSMLFTVDAPKVLPKC